MSSLQLGGTSQTPLREDFTYTLPDQVATQTRYSDLAGQNMIGSSTFAYDCVGRLTNSQHLDGGGNNIANYVNAFDLSSRITSETLNAGTSTNYNYDVTNQLTDDSTVSYSYDLNGNRTMPGYTTGPANDLTSDGIWNYYHDKNGNLVGKSNINTGETWTYAYDNRNRLTSATQTTSAGLQMQATYVYNALGQRIEKDVTQNGSTVVTRFAYDRGEIWADLDATNGLQTRYVRGERVLELLARIASGTAAWVLADRMGSVRNVTDDTGAVIDTIAYDGYGNITSETNAANGGQYKYDGYRYDSETGLYRSDPSTGRYYDPLTGKWFNPDPIRFLADDINLYRYVKNAPVIFVDPFGLAGLKVKYELWGRKVREYPFWHSLSWVNAGSVVVSIDLKVTNDKVSFLMATAYPQNATQKVVIRHWVEGLILRTNNFYTYDTIDLTGAAGLVDNDADCGRRCGFELRVSFYAQAGKITDGRKKDIKAKAAKGVELEFGGESSTSTEEAPWKTSSGVKLKICPDGRGDYTLEVKDTDRLAENPDEEYEFTTWDDDNRFFKNKWSYEKT